LRDWSELLSPRTGSQDQPDNRNVSAVRVLALHGGSQMPRYYFDIKDGHRFVDPKGLAFKNDHDAIERAKVIAIGVSIDKPEVDPTRHISVLNEAKVEIFKAPVYSKPTAIF
jgi:hypothetical protein